MKYFKAGVGVPGKEPLQQDNEAIDMATRYFGIFCNVTTMQCSAREAISTYRTRDVIEKAFKGGKSNLDFDVVRAHGESTMEGRFIVGFVALSILTELYGRMKRCSFENTKTGLKEIAPLIEEMSFNEMKNRLSTPRVVYDGQGKAHWLEVTNRQHEIATRLGFPNLYKQIPDWA